jgi:hypothetical protein
MTVESLEFVLCMCFTGPVSCGTWPPPPLLRRPPPWLALAPLLSRHRRRRARSRASPGGPSVIRPATGSCPSAAGGGPCAGFAATAPVAASPVLIPSDVDISDAGFSSITAPVSRTFVVNVTGYEEESRRSPRTKNGRNGRILLCYSTTLLSASHRVFVQQYI